MRHDEVTRHKEPGTSAPTAAEQVTTRPQDVPAASVLAHMNDLRRQIETGQEIYLEPGIRIQPALAVAARRIRKELKIHDQRTARVVGLENVREVLDAHGF